MKAAALLSTLLAVTLTALPTHAQVPQMVNYQGRVVVNGTNFHGTGQFKFALVDEAGTSSYWSNDGTSANGSEPSSAVFLGVSKGLFSVALGDPILGISGIPATVFTNEDVRIRTWFSHGGGFQQLSPDQRIVAVGYAMVAASVDGDLYIERSGDTMTGALRVTDGTGASGHGGNLHVGANEPDADPKLINFGDLDPEGRGWVSIGERGEDDTLEIRAKNVYISPSAGGMYAVGIGVSNPVERLEVDGGIKIGSAINQTAGTIRWTGTDFEGYNGSVWVSLTKGTATEVPAGMVYVPGGTFEMGDPYREGSTDELPVHYVYVSPFLMEKYQVTSNLWSEVYTWAIANGYGFDNAGTASASNHPIHTVNWYDCVKWCNARSQKEGLTPVYYTSSAMTTIYTNGQIDIATDCVNWTTDGYRLPTEAEWEKAARGGSSQNHYPWPSLGGSSTNHIDGSKANFLNSGDPYDNGTTPVGYYDGNQIPAGGNMANGYGLYDMSGNVWEWCWDWYSDAWYKQSGATEADTRGPGVGTKRVERGGWWDNGYLYYLRCADRFIWSAPAGATASEGFRCMRSVQ